MLLSLVARFTPIHRRRMIAYKYLAPIIKERLASADEHGNWGKGKGQKPDDLLQWLIDAAPPDDKSPMKLVERMMAANFGALHSTIMVQHCLPPDFSKPFLKVTNDLGPNRSSL
jgi:hypothetical protein